MCHRRRTCMRCFVFTLSFAIVNFLRIISKCGISDGKHSIFMSKIVKKKSDEIVSIFRRNRTSKRIRVNCVFIVDGRNEGILSLSSASTNTMLTMSFPI